MPTPRWNRMAEMYRRFAPTDCALDWSDEAADAMFRWESSGDGELAKSLFATKPENGFAVGKKWMDVTVASWTADIKAGLLFPAELDGELPPWFLRRVLGMAFYAWRPKSEREALMDDLGEDPDDWLACSCA